MTIASATSTTTTAITITIGLNGVLDVVGAGLGADDPPVEGGPGCGPSEGGTLTPSEAIQAALKAARSAPVAVVKASSSVTPWE